MSLIPLGGHTQGDPAGDFFGDIITNSLLFDSADSSSLSKAISFNGSDDQHLIMSAWYRRLASNETVDEHPIYIGNGTIHYVIMEWDGTSSDSMLLQMRNDNTTLLSLRCSPILKDATAWMHVVMALDLDNATQADRAKVWINGNRITDFNESSIPANTTTTIKALLTGATIKVSDDIYVDGYLARVQIHNTDSLDETAFGEFHPVTGQWVPKGYSTAHSDLDIRLDFEDATNLGYDSLGGSNRLTYSEQIDNIVWNKSQITVSANTAEITDPLGTNTADKIINTVDNNIHRYAQGVNLSTAGVYSGVAILKAGSLDWINVLVWNATDGSIAKARFNLSTGVISSTSQIGDNFIESLGNGWYKCGVSGTVTTTGIQTFVLVYLQQDETTESYTGATTEYIYSAGIALNEDLDYRYLRTEASARPTGNTLTATNLTSANQVNDTPTNTFPILHHFGFASVVQSNLNNGGLESVESGGATEPLIPCTTAFPSTGKWCFEGKMITGGANISIGTARWNEKMENYAGPGSSFINYAKESITSVFVEGTEHTLEWSSNPGVNVWIMCMVDMDNKTIKWKTATDSTSAISFSDADTLFPAFWHNEDTIEVNFGQRDWNVTPDSGYQSICTANMPEPDIANPTKYFDILSWTGDDAATRDISGLSFQPDLAILFNINDGTIWHSVYDSLRGAGYSIYTNDTIAEDFNSGYGYVDEFRTDGLGLTKGTQSTSYTNATGDNYEALCWKKNRLAGFDIVEYSGDNTANRNINHNLGKTIEFAIVKRTDSSENWFVWHKELSSDIHFLKLDINQVESPANTPWGTGNWSSTQFMVTNNTLNNTNGSGTDNYIAYLWTGIEGFSKFTSYVGNGGLEGPYVHLGFRPKVVVIKRLDLVSNNWYIFDSARDPYNEMIGSLEFDTPDVEDISADRDDIFFMANGFRVTEDSAGINADQSRYIVMAWAEAPEKYSRAF